MQVFQLRYVMLCLRFLFYMSITFSHECIILLTKQYANIKEMWAYNDI